MKCVKDYPTQFVNLTDFFKKANLILNLKIERSWLEVFGAIGTPSIHLVLIFEDLSTIIKMLSAQ